MTTETAAQAASQSPEVAFALTTPGLGSAPRRPWVRGVRRFYRDPKALVASIILGAFIFVGFSAPVIAPNSPL